MFFDLFLIDLYVFSLASPPQFSNGQADPWAPVRVFVRHFNNTRQAHVHPGQGITVDESMSSWRGRSLKFISDGEEAEIMHVGLPHKTKIQRKPKGVGLEIRDAACAQSGIMLRLELQEGKEAMSAMAENKLHGSGTGSTIRLTKPWHGTSRVVYGDSAFASVRCARQMRAHGLHFIGIVKTSTKEYPLKWLRSHTYTARGAHVALKAKDKLNNVYYACGWSDRTVKTFIATCKTTLPADVPARKPQYHLKDGVVTVTHKDVPRPAMVECYFDAANAIDVHNHLRQGSLALEQSWKTQVWWHRTFATLLGITVVDSFLGAKLTYPDRFPDKLSEFVLSLATLMARNTDSLGPAASAHQHRLSQCPTPPPLPPAPFGFLPLSSLPQYVETLQQGLRPRRRCTVCHLSCSYFCTSCSQDDHIVPIHNPMGSHGCWNMHIATRAHRKLR